MAEVKFDSAIVLYQSGQPTGVILKAEVAAITVAIDNEYVIYIYLKNGQRIEHFPSDDTDEEFNSELMRLISDMGWS